VLWPLLLIAAGAVAGRWLWSRESANRDCANVASTDRWSRWARIRLWAGRTVLVIGLLVIVVDSGSRLGGIDFTIPHARLDGQAWVARRAGATGLLIDWQYGSGGRLWLGRSIPQVEYRAELLENPLFSHVLADKGSSIETEARRQGFAPGFDRGGIVVLERAH